MIREIFQCRECRMISTYTVHLPTGDTTEPCPNDLCGGTMELLTTAENYKELRTIYLKVMSEIHQRNLAISGLVKHIIAQCRRGEAGLPIDPKVEDYALRIARKAGVEITPLRQS